MISRGLVRTSLCSRSGSALIEFALIAPILVSLLLGMYDLAPALLVRFKLAGATQAVADIATQTPTIKIADVVNVFAAGGDVMAPFSSSGLVLRITNIASNGVGGTLAGAFVYWSCGQGALPPYNAATIVQSLPTGTPLTDLMVLSPTFFGSYLVNGLNTSLIMVESQYTFTPPAGFVIRSAQVLTGTAYALPRVSTYIGWSTGLLNFIPPLPILTIGNQSTTQSGITCNTGIL